MASAEIANTSQYYSINPYKNIKWEILKCNSNIYLTNDV